MAGLHEWYESKINNITETIGNDDIVKVALKEADDHITRCAIKLLIANHDDRLYLLDRIPIPLPFFSSANDREKFNNTTTQLALDIFGLEVPHEYFLAKYLTRLNCQHMAPNDAVRAFF